MEVIQKLMTANECYQAGGRITVKGLMVHSTATPGVMAADWFSRWNKPGIEKGVHAFMDNTICYQYLPWHWRGWHCGGKANGTHIGIEWCEPKDLNDQDYFAKIWANGVSLYAMLCKQFSLTEKNIISHAEGYKLGVASNHGDPMHWWKLHGKTMDDFRADVAKALKGEDDSKPYRVLVHNTNLWQARLLVNKYETRGYKCEGLGLPKNDMDACPFVIYTTLGEAKLLVNELHRDGYPTAKGEAIDG